MKQVSYKYYVYIVFLYLEDYYYIFCFTLNPKRGSMHILIYIYIVGSTPAIPVVSLSVPLQYILISDLSRMKLSPHACNV